MDLEEIRRRARAATPEPWDRHGADLWAHGVLLFRGRDGDADIRRQADLDAEFLAHARTDVLALLDRLEALERRPSRPGDEPGRDPGQWLG